jgi:hypothetical protein
MGRRVACLSRQTCSSFATSAPVCDADGDPPRLVRRQHLGLQRFSFVLPRIDVHQCLPVRPSNSDFLHIVGDGAIDLISQA